ncbi:MAG: protein translocase subunit SecF [Dehalococcoidales bacterium]|nr:protein translocase subunit SecF [Dehalococcoidales bacterium]
MINIIGKRYWFFLLSAIIIIPGLISLAVSWISTGDPLKPGIDFRSGTSLTLHFVPTVEENKLRQELATLGYGDAVVQYSQSADDFLIRLREINNDEKQELTAGLGTTLSANVTVRDFASASPIVTGETARNASFAVVLAAIGILLYITWAFRRMPNPLRWGTCAIIALLHDVLVVLGIFSILGWAAGVEVDSLFITAMLTVAGFSVHDTIVVFDRIRENMIKGIGGDFADVVNYSTVQTLARSLNTSLTVLFVLLALFLLGGSTIHYFVLVLLIGVTTGTYSSICNASALLVVWQNREWGRFIGRKPQLASKTEQG